MALLDAYATAAEFRARTDKGTTSEDADILATLKGVSRTLDMDLGWAAGSFNPGVAGTQLYFDGRGTSKLYLEDDMGLIAAISAIATDGIAIDVDNDGVYEYTVDPTGESWIVAGPRNAAVRGRPYTWLEILPNVSGAPLSFFPIGRGNIRVSCTPGWAATPEAIKDYVIKRARDIRDTQKSGAAGSFAVMDGQVAMRADTWRVWKAIEEQYSERIPGVA